MNRTKMFKSRVARRLAIYIILTSVVLTVVSASYHIYNLRRIELQQVDKTITLINTSYLPSLNHAVWIYNYDQAEVLLDGALGFSDIEYLSIVVNDKEVVSAGILKSKQTIIKEFPLVRQHNDEDMQFGTLKIVISLDLIYERLKVHAISLLAHNALIIFLSAAFLLIFFHYVIGRYLSSLASEVSTLDIYTSDEALQSLVKKTKNHDEIDNVALAIIQMREKIRNSIERLKDSEKHLHLVFDNAPVCLFQEDFSELKDQIESLKRTGVFNLEEYFNNHPEALMGCAQKIRITNVNQMALKLHGAESKEELLRGLPQTFTEESFKIFKKEVVALADGHNHFRSEAVIQSLDGQKKHVLLELFIDPSKADWSRTYVTLTDLTELKEAETKRLELEEHIRQKYKMEAIGQMAGGIAHNFNNSLAIILGNLEMAQRKSSQPDKAKNYIENAQTAALRSRDLVAQIMTYSRKGNYNKAPVQLSMIVDETLMLLRSTNPSTVKLSSHISSSSETTTVIADSSQIQEVLINLYNNALHAMGEDGEISITLQTVELEHGDIPAQYECSPGIYSKLSVQDNGSGMTQNTLSKIFDPFYTTKDVGEGTGMGLSTVQGIIDQHDGLIKVRSTPEEGTLFELYFPVTENQQPNHPRKNIEPHHGTEKILFVDDEKMLIDLADQMFSDLGYDITTATSGTQALQMIKDNPHRFDLIITDQTMPRMTGQELSREIMKINPELPIILCTGYSTKISEEEAEQYGISAFCSKPLNLSEFSQVVRKVLDEQ